MVCRLTKMAHFDPCQKGVTTEQDSPDVYITKCYRLHGAPKVIVSPDSDPKYDGKKNQSLWER
jgi:hypothetical protein